MVTLCSWVSGRLANKKKNLHIVWKFIVKQPYFWNVMHKGNTSWHTNMDGDNSLRPYPSIKSYRQSMTVDRGEGENRFYSERAPWYVIQSQVVSHKHFYAYTILKGLSKLYICTCRTAIIKEAMNLRGTEHRGNCWRKGNERNDVNTVIIYEILKKSKTFMFTSRKSHD